MTIVDAPMVTIITSYDVSVEFNLLSFLFSRFMGPDSPYHVLDLFRSPIELKLINNCTTLIHGMFQLFITVVYNYTKPKD